MLLFISKTPREHKVSNNHIRIRFCEVSNNHHHLMYIGIIDRLHQPCAWGATQPRGRAPYARATWGTLKKTMRITTIKNMVFIFNVIK